MNAGDPMRKDEIELGLTFRQGGKASGDLRGPAPGMALAGGREAAGFPQEIDCQPGRCSGMPHGAAGGGVRALRAQVFDVSGYAVSGSQRLVFEPAANQGLALIGNRTFAVADTTPAPRRTLWSPPRWKTAVPIPAHWPGAVRGFRNWRPRIATPSAPPSARAPCWRTTGSPAAPLAHGSHAWRKRRSHRGRHGRQHPGTRRSWRALWPAAPWSHQLDRPLRLPNRRNFL